MRPGGDPGGDGPVAWGLAVLLVGALMMLVVPVAVPEIRPSAAFRECDASGGRWDRGAQVCRPPESPLAGVPH